MKKVCVVTGTRAEYGLLRWVMDGIQKSKSLKLQIIATGMHLSHEFGLTFREIEKDGFVIDKKVDMLVSSDTPQGITKSMGLGMIGFADALEDLRPDLMLVLGDRYEIFSAVAATMISRIPVAHLHGGEATEGLIDEPIRHSVTKMSHLHFVATEEYRKRVIQLGEKPRSVFMVGGLGIDNIVKLNLLSHKELEQTLDFKLGSKNLMITFHPVTLENSTSEVQMQELLAALGKLKDHA
jgi:GDP/UDP-N,N'-diacetylbacillosamine 2-epimerase (hydrolysing)